MLRHQDGLGFQMLQVTLFVFVEDDAWVQDAFGVQQGLDALHDAEGLLSPLVFHKGGHVAACAVLRLQGAVVFAYYQLHDIADHGVVALNVFPCLKRLIDNEMEVPFQSMAINAGIFVSVPVQKGRKVRRGGRQVLDMEGDVFNEAGCPLFAKAAHRGEDAGADGPVLRHLLRVRREADVYVERFQRGRNGLYLLFQGLRRLCLGLGKDSGQIGHIGL